MVSVSIRLFTHKWAPRVAQARSGVNQERVSPRPSRVGYGISIQVSAGNNKMQFIHVKRNAIQG
jgi:hypothetical protein